MRERREKMCERREFGDEREKNQVTEFWKLNSKINFLPSDAFRSFYFCFHFFSVPQFVSYVRSKNPGAYLFALMLPSGVGIFTPSNKFQT